MTLIISVLSSFSTIKILIGRFKNYHITRTIPLPAATVVYCKINALPAGNRLEITVFICSQSRGAEGYTCKIQAR